MQGHCQKGVWFYADFSHFATAFHPEDYPNLLRRNGFLHWHGTCLYHWYPPGMRVTMIDNMGSVLVASQPAGKR
jgi:hypothetical protein